MKRLLIVLLAFAIIPVMSTAATYRSVEVDDNATYVDMGRVAVSDWNGFYAFLDQLKNLEKVDMYSTQVWKNRIDEMKARYPDIEFGWTMRFAEHSVRTDATAFSTLHGSSSTTHSANDIGLVRYCKDLKALDFGHNGVKDISFLYELPELRVLIMACNRLEDITPVASLKHLEYLELFTNRITDLTPLSELHELKHLNICWNRKLADISPIYGLDLERLWIGCLTQVPKEQIEKYRELHPDCLVNDEVLDSHTDWRWDKDRNYYPRYALLRQQLGYHYPEGGTDYVFYWMDPLYEPHDDSVTDPLCPY